MPLLFSTETLVLNIEIFLIYKFKWISNLVQLKSINTYLNYLTTIRILNFKYVFINIAAPNWILYIHWTYTCLFTLWTLGKNPSLIRFSSNSNKFSSSFFILTLFWLSKKALDKLQYFLEIKNNKHFFALTYVKILKNASKGSKKAKFHYRNFLIRNTSYKLVFTVWNLNILFYTIFSKTNNEPLTSSPHKYETLGSPWNELIRGIYIILYVKISVFIWLKCRLIWINNQQDAIIWKDHSRNLN